jgi:hypothetical protein
LEARLTCFVDHFVAGLAEGNSIFKGKTMVGKKSPGLDMVGMKIESRSANATSMMISFQNLLPPSYAKRSRSFGAGIFTFPIWISRTVAGFP